MVRLSYAIEFISFSIDIYSKVSYSIKRKGLKVFLKIHIQDEWGGGLLPGLHGKRIKRDTPIFGLKTKGKVDFSKLCTMFSIPHKNKFWMPEVSEVIGIF
jgi:hypothetical protein